MSCEVLLSGIDSLVASVLATLRSPPFHHLANWQLCLGHRRHADGYGPEPHHHPGEAGCERVIEYDMGTNEIRVTFDFPDARLPSTAQRDVRSAGYGSSTTASSSQPPMSYSMTRSQSAATWVMSDVSCPHPSSCPRCPGRRCWTAIRGVSGWMSGEPPTQAKREEGGKHAGASSDCAPRCRHAAAVVATPCCVFGVSPQSNCRLSTLHQLSTRPHPRHTRACGAECGAMASAPPGCVCASVSSTNDAHALLACPLAAQPRGAASRAGAVLPLPVV